MLSSRNIHFAFLGIIIGASLGYVLAFYQAQAALPQLAAKPQQQADSKALPPNHPDLTSEEAISSLKKMVDENPKDTQILARYANTVLRAGHFEEAAQAYRSLLNLDPGNLEIRSLLATLLWRNGSMDDAKKEIEKALSQDPRHLPSLHVKVLVALDGDHDVAKAAQIFQTMEKLDPKYQGLPALRERLEEERGKTKTP